MKEKKIDEKKIDEKNNNDEINLENLIINELLEERVIILEDQLAELKKSNKKYNKKLLRLQSDFSNYRNRVKKEKKEQDINNRIELISKILPVLDNFERALISYDESPDFKKGVEMIYKQFINILQKEDVEIIEAVDKPFDHSLHEAVMQVETEDVESGIVTEELQKGYILDDKLIRPAMVKVAK